MAWYWVFDSGWCFVDFLGVSGRLEGILVVCLEGGLRAEVLIRGVVSAIRRDSVSLSWI